MKINWKVRLKNKAFWLAIIPAVILLVQQILAIFGVALELAGIEEQLVGIVGTVFAILALVGVVTDPIIVAKNINGYVFVTLANFSDAIRVNRAIEAIENVGGKITGIVVNGNSRKGAAYSSKRNHYKYSYTDNSDD